MTKYKLFLVSILVSFFAVLGSKELPNFSNLAEEASPAVVTLQARGRLKKEMHMDVDSEIPDMMSFLKGSLVNNLDLLCQERIQDR